MATVGVDRQRPQDAAAAVDGEFEVASDDQEAFSCWARVDADRVAAPADEPVGADPVEGGSRWEGVDAGGLGVEDLGSTNGTWVNGRKIARAPLSNGDRLKIGRVEFCVKSVQ